MPAGVEGGLDGAEDGDLGGRAVQVEPAALGPADAVLGADAAAVGDGEAQDGVVDPVVVGRGADHVDVDVAVAEVAEEVKTAVAAAWPPCTSPAKAASWPSGQRDVELVGHALVGDRLGDPLAELPEAARPAGSSAATAGRSPTTSSRAASGVARRRRRLRAR